MLDLENLLEMSSHTILRPRTDWMKAVGDDRQGEVIGNEENLRENGEEKEETGKKKKIMSNVKNQCMFITGGEKIFGNEEMMR